jgi:pimeloyl-ACP methyl ester carboxylesterase
MPEFVTKDGCRLRYDLRGEGPLIALTPGGREGGQAVTALADTLAERARVLSWDRRNSGQSHVFFGGEGSEQEIWADDLADLIDHLGVGPAWLAGGSAGCRVSLLTALRRPGSAQGLILWSASGGPYGCQFLGYKYHVPFIMAAELGGMAQVAKTPFFGALIRANPDNHTRLMALDPQAFIATLKRWNAFFYYREDTPVVGAGAEDLAGLSLPVLIFEGNDDIHPPAVSQAMARLIPGATLVPSPWPTKDWMDRFTGRAKGSVFDLYPLLAPAIFDFIGQG